MVVDWMNWNANFETITWLVLKFKARLAPQNVLLLRTSMKRVSSSLTCKESQLLPCFERMQKAPSESSQPGRGLGARHGVAAHLPSCGSGPWNHVWNRDSVGIRFRGVKGGTRQTRLGECVGVGIREHSG